MRLFPGCVAVVTGAAEGLGRALSVRLAHRGCDLALVDIDGAALSETARSVRGADRRASLHVVDVADRVAMERLPEEILAAHSGASTSW